MPLRWVGVQEAQGVPGWTRKISVEGSEGRAGGGDCDVVVAMEEEGGDGVVVVVEEGVEVVGEEEREDGEVEEEETIWEAMRTGGSTVVTEDEGSELLVGDVSAEMGPRTLDGAGAEDVMEGTGLFTAAPTAGGEVVVGSLGVPAIDVWELVVDDAASIVSVMVGCIMSNEVWVWMASDVGTVLVYCSVASLFGWTVPIGTDW